METPEHGHDPDWSRVEALFDDAMERDPAERVAWVRAAAANATEAAEVLALLAAADRRGILDTPPEIDRAALAQRGEMVARLSAALAGRYVIDRVLGEGGMATVFLAHECKHERSVVLKVLRPEVAGWIGADRFLAEIQILAKLSHPHILALIDSGEADGLLYYVMPYVGGETLRDRLERGAIGPTDALPILRDISAALAHAHAQQFVHRDLKPDNILIVDGHAFLMDFGIAKLLPTAMNAHHTSATQGHAIGTPAYMAPEQAAGLTVDVRADLYSWGIVAREVLVGRLDVASRYPTPVPSPLRRLIDHCLEVDPTKRPTDGAALQSRLDAIVLGGARNMRRFALPLAAAAALLLLAVGYFAWSSRGATGVISLETMAGPVMVAPLANETGDESLAVWGRLAGDWLTQSLHQTGRIAVVPWPSSLQAVDATRDVSPTLALRALANETGARTVVTGAYYLTDGIVRFQAQLTDLASGVVVATLPTVEVPRDSMREGVQQLRERLMGMVAINTDARLAGMPGIASQPPTYDAYRHFERGIDRFNALDYVPATDAFLEAWHSDTTFDVALMYAAYAYLNRSDYQRSDSLLRALRARSHRLDPFHELTVRFMEAQLAGDGQRALEMARQAVAIAPGGRAAYSVAVTALGVGQSAEAISVLRSVDPDRGMLNGWAPYWFVLTHAQHLQGDYRGELAASLELRRRYPDNRAAWVHEVRALAALGEVQRADSVVAAASALPPDTYWSQGAMLVTIAEELDAHGHAGSDRYYASAIDWLEHQLARDSLHRAHRYWLASAWLDRGVPARAEPILATLVRDAPTSVLNRGLWGVVAALRGDTALARERLGEAPTYRRGDHLAYLARYASVAGDRERAIALWSEAVGTGLNGIVWVHAVARRELDAVGGDPRFRLLGILPPDFSGVR